MEEQKLDEKSVFSVTVSKDLLDELEEARSREEYDISRNAFINGLLRKALKLGKEEYLD